MCMVEDCIKKWTNITWDDAIGHELAKASLQETVVWPFKYQWYFENKDQPFQGVLMYGVPGVGKTILARISACMSDSVLFEVRSSDVKSMWFGKSERFVRLLFEKAKTFDRSIIFIDEMEALFSDRNAYNSSASDGIVQEFLIELSSKAESQSGAGSVVVIGATNLPSRIDPAIMRRFEKIIPLQLPDTREREQMFRFFMQRHEHSLAHEDFKTLSVLSSGFTGSDVEIVVKNAWLEPLRIAERLGLVNHDMLNKTITTEMMTKWVRKTTPSVTGKMIESMQKYDASYNVSSNRQRDERKKTGCCASLVRAFLRNA